MINLRMEINGEFPFHSFTHFSLQQSFDWHHTFELHMPLDHVEEQGAHVLDKSRNLVGQKVEFEFISVEDGTVQSIFNGIITRISIHRSGPHASNLVINGFSPTILLDHGSNSHYFSNHTLSSIAHDAIAKYPAEGIHYKINPHPDPLVDFALQYQESTYNFIARMADKNGQWFSFNGTDCFLGLPPEEKAIELTLGDDLRNFNMGMRMNAPKFKIKAHNYIDDKTYESTPQQVSGLGDLGEFALQQSQDYFFQEQTQIAKQPGLTVTELNEIAKLNLAHIASALVGLTGSSFNAKLKIGSVIKVKAPEADGKIIEYGEFIIVKLQHFVTGTGRYSNNFDAIPSGLTNPPKNMHVSSPRGETQSAIVAQTNDPQGLGRVKLKFFWQENANDTTPWIRVVTPHGGKNRGIQFIPEVNDEVLISFEQNNIDRPIVTGSLYNGHANHSDRADHDNYIKTIRTISGNEIRFIDKLGGEEIIIMNKNGDNQISLNLNEGGKITIQSKGTIEMKADKIKIDADNELTLSGITIKLDAVKEVEMSSIEKITVASPDIEIKGSLGLKLAGAAISVKADASLDLEGGVTEVKGTGALKASSTGTTVIEGAMVMIN